MFTAVVTVRAQPDKYEMDFHAVVAFLTKYTDKSGPTLRKKFAFIAQTQPMKWQKTSTVHGTFKGKIELKKYSR